MLKDYYALLELPPHASLDEIKQAYRRIAMFTHPDHNEKDPEASARFLEVKEAYETLTNPVRKDNYLQERWYQQSIGRWRMTTHLSPELLLKSSLELEKYVSTLDSYRMNRTGLAHYIDEFLSPEAMEIIRRSKNPSLIYEIVHALVRAMRFLPLETIEKPLDKLAALSAADDNFSAAIQKFIKAKKREQLWRKSKVFVILLLAIIICLLIFFTTK
jgi:curved DNA-binding protein CbpA